MFSRIRYRAKQFAHALRAKPTPEGLVAVQRILTVEEFALFRQMSIGEQAHAIAVLEDVQMQPWKSPPPRDVWVAALLHDVGKARYPLRLWERVIIVVAWALIPNRVHAWGQQKSVRGWARPFVIAEQHPVWGAEMAEKAHTSPLACTLIRRHQDKLSAEVQKAEDQFLRVLQMADNRH